MIRLFRKKIFLANPFHIGYLTTETALDSLAYALTQNESK